MFGVNCKFCHDRGCVACAGEREKRRKEMPEPIFVARSREDIELLKPALGREAMEERHERLGGDMDAFARETHDLLITARIQQLIRSLDEEE